MFGGTKAVLAYQGHSVSPTTLEWIFRVIFSIGLYWLGLYEESAVNAGEIPWLFEKDYWKFALLYSARFRVLRRLRSGVLITLYSAIGLITFFVIYVPIILVAYYFAEFFFGGQLPPSNYGHVALSMIYTLACSAVWILWLGLCYFIFISLSGYFTRNPGLP
ncbi:hypothetical protein BD410DRAFT_793476, partial [Rickenella mellea]